MKKTLGAIFALGILAALPASAQAGAVKPALATEAASAIVKVDWDDYHGRWRSHNRYGSGGFGYGHRSEHYRWRSHRRYGSGGFGYGDRDRDGRGSGGHDRHRSHHRHGSGGFGNY